MCRKRAVYFALIIVLLFTGIHLIGDPVVSINNRRLARAIRAIEEDEVHLNAVIPFPWDVLYTFSPYQSKAEIERRIGFSSPSIQANNINEGMVHLIFTHENKVTACILGYADSLGYDIDITQADAMKVTFDENASFFAERRNDMIRLYYRQQKNIEAEVQEKGD